LPFTIRLKKTSYRKESKISPQFSLSLGFK